MLHQFLNVLDFHQHSDTGYGYLDESPGQFPSQKRDTRL